MFNKFTLSFAVFLILAFSSNNANAEKVAIGGMAAAKDVWYSLTNGQVSEADAMNWDLSFGSGDRTASISTNDAKGIELYYVGEDFNEILDISKLSEWTRYINSDSTWNLGSISRKASTDDPFDFGWGQYNVATHNVLGNSVYVIKLADGSYKKLFIDMLDGKARFYQFLYADLDGGNEKTIKVDYSTTNANNLYFSFADNTIFEREPASDTWELVFGRYLAFIQEQYYPVTGVRNNGNVLSLRVEYENDINPTDRQTAPEVSQLTSNISTIGSDWKQFTGQNYVFANNRAHFLQKYKIENKVNVPDGDMYQIIFTNFVGGPVGEMEFTLINLNAQSVKDEKGNSFYLYPNELNAGETSTLVMSSVSNENYVINLFDIMGNVVYTTNYNSNIGLNQINLPSEIISKLSKGMYFVGLNSNSNNYQLKFIVK